MPPGRACGSVKEAGIYTTREVQMQIVRSPPFTRRDSDIDSHCIRPSSLASCSRHGRSILEAFCSSVETMSKRLSSCPTCAHSWCGLDGPGVSFPHLASSALPGTSFRWAHRFLVAAPGSLLGPFDAGVLRHLRRDDLYDDHRCECDSASKSCPISTRLRPPARHILRMQRG